MRYAISLIFIVDITPLNLHIFRLHLHLPIKD